MDTQSVRSPGSSDIHARTKSRRHAPNWIWAWLLTAGMVGLAEAQNTDPRGRRRQQRADDHSRRADDR